MSVSNDDEEPLSGGAQTPGLVRVGHTVRRRRHSRSGFVQALLTHLEAAGFEGAPRALGYDEQGREVLTYVAGDVPHGLPHRLTDGQLRSATSLIREFHDATTTSSLCSGEEVVCHGDLGPHNTVFRGDAAIAIIDWDADAAPGRRIVDFAHAVWCFADVTEEAVPVDEQARKLRVMCAAYPGMLPIAIVEELTARFHRARAEHAAAERVKAIEVFDRLITWMEFNGTALLVGSGPRSIPFADR